MPLVDRRTSSVVLRIVYDGPPEAGKTTNLRHLSERLSLSRRGALESPGGHARTQFFDWLDVTGGWIGGHRVRCQLVTVPGQIQLARRRRYILDSADVVVFVADSRSGAAAEVQAALRSLARALDHRARVPLVLQANKQDLVGARPPTELHHALSLGEDVPAIAARASSGVGVLETFMLAVRLAVDHVRTLIVGGQLEEGDAGGASELLAALGGEASGTFSDMISETISTLEAIGETAGALVARAQSPAEAAPAEEAPAEEAPAEEAPEEDNEEGEEGDEEGDEPGNEAVDEALDAVSRRASLPHGNIATGLVWPPQAGRAALRDLDRQRAGGAVPRELGESRMRCGTWLLESHRAGWRDIDRARRALLEAVVVQPALAEVAPGQRALAISDAEGWYRLWYLAAVPHTLAELADRDRASVLAAVDRANLELVPRLTAIAEERDLDLELGLDAIDETGTVFAGAAWPRPRGAPGRPRMPAELALPGPAPAPTPVSPPGDARVEQPAAGAAVAAVAVEAGRVGLALPPPPDPIPFRLPPVDLPAGLVWPGISGRAALAALSAPVRVITVVAPWAPAGALELQCSDGWVAHTSPQLRFAELEDGRTALFEAVRWQASLGGLTPPGRTYALSPEDDGARLWILTPSRTPAWTQLEEAFARGDREQAATIARRALAALDYLREHGLEVGDLDHVTAEQPPVLLHTPWTIQSSRLVAQCKRLLAVAAP